ncbi:MAG: methylated-DNA--[protein]-cysteine S-methyltransferase [Pseudomonadota bacterium]
MDKNALFNGCRTTRIYCLPGCPAGRRTKPENRVRFGSREEARATGYRACKICKPDGPDTPTKILFLQHYQSPLGTYILASSDRGVACVKTEVQAPAFFARWEREKFEIRGEGGFNRELESELDAYFAGNLRQFSVPLDLKGTAFQHQVWKLLSGIPYGGTRTYRQIAEALGRPQAARAVGRAVGSNPVAIVVPCHRVVGSHGGLTGYGGGLERKKALLSLEATHL